MRRRCKRRPKELNATPRSRDPPRGSLDPRAVGNGVAGWLDLLRESIHAVPINRFAFGVVGVASGSSVALTLFENLEIGLLTTLFMFFMMMLLVLFLWMWKLGLALYKPMALVFGWMMFSIIGGFLILVLTA